MPAQSAYIHIPFCSYKCDFCDFAAFAGVDHLADEYLTVILSEIESRLLAENEAIELKTIFFGGGTPGLVPAEHLEQILAKLRDCAGISADAEISMETTPHSISLDKARQWLQIGINRLSVGVQSFQDQELAAMGRDHRVCDVLKGVDAARQAGFINMGLDLMYGLPEQTLQSWQNTLDCALDLHLPHLSAYGLTIAGNSPLLLRYPLDSKSYPSEDVFAQMYQMLVQKAESSGLAQYEISNFARPGFQSRHNLAYWQGVEYFAFGVGAHRFVAGKRTANLRSLKRYMREPLANELEEVIDDKTKAVEFVMLGLRTRKGISKKRYSEYFGQSPEDKLGEKLNTLVAEDLIELEGDSLRLTQKGILISNLVIGELV